MSTENTKDLLPISLRRAYANLTVATWIADKIYEVALKGDVCCLDEIKRLEAEHRRRGQRAKDYLDRYTILSKQLGGIGYDYAVRMAEEENCFDCQVTTITPRDGGDDGE